MIKAIGVVLVSVTLLSAQKRTVSDAEVKRVHASALLIDTHDDFPTEQAGNDRPAGAAIDIGVPSPMAHTDLARLREGGVGGVFFAAYVAASYGLGPRAYERGLEVIGTIHHIVDRYPNDFAFATTAAEIEAAHKQGKIAAMIGVEGGHAIDDSLDELREFHRRGARYMTLTHTNTNHWADSSGDMKDAKVTHHNGLTDFGKDVVREMNRLGMMVDISHVADKTFWDALDVSTAPIFASHSSCRALSSAGRNMTDDMIRALARKGGVIDINFSCGFLSQKAADAERDIIPKLLAARNAEDPGLAAEYRRSVPRATLADVVEHIDHVVKIAGVDAVGLGSDFDGIMCTPEGLDDV